MPKYVCVLTEQPHCVYYDHDAWVLLRPGATAIEGDNKAALEACINSETFKKLAKSGQVRVVNSISEIPWGQMPIEVQQSRRREIQTEQTKHRNEELGREQIAKIAAEAESLERALQKQRKVTHVDMDTGAVQFESA